ncbi:MAG TPA: apolipoprotein N-acyltransferase [Candidatus Acidoferrales bacterium]|nr:apolipoprotein N-acyltransferase [Candidatus Acidoferrales bacterium]
MAAPNAAADIFQIHTITRISFGALSGLLLVFAYPKFHFYVAGWFSVALLMAAAAGARPRVAALAGYVQGIVFYVGTLTWLDTVFQLHGGVGPVMAAVALGLIVAVASLFRLFFAWAFARLARRSVALACLAAPFLWVLIEFGIDQLPAIGFPWNLLGYTAANSLAIAQLAPIAGIWGLSFLVVAFNALLFWGIAELRARRSLPMDLACGIAIILGLIAWLGPRAVPQAHPDHQANLVQTNFPEPDYFPADWLDQHAAEMDELGQLSLTAPSGNLQAGPTIWPEVPAPFSMQDPKFAARALLLSRQIPDGFLVGVIDWKARPGVSWRVYNSAALLVPPGREAFLYDKIHLVPFAEHVPFGKLFTFVRSITIEVGNFESGNDYKAGTLPDGNRFGVFICYESIFPSEVRKFVASGAQFLVNISNDGWFGRSAAPEQHFAMARVRAIENRRWLLRCTNNGYTASIDPYGRIVAQLPTDVRDHLLAPYAARSDLTLYARFGDWLPWLCVMVSAGFLIANFRRTRAKI